MAHAVGGRTPTSWPRWTTSSRRRSSAARRCWSCATSRRSDEAAEDAHASTCCPRSARAGAWSSSPGTRARCAGSRRRAPRPAPWWRCRPSRSATRARRSRGSSGWRAAPGTRSPPAAVAELVRAVRREPRRGRRRSWTSSRCTPGTGKRIDVAHVDAVVPATRMHEVYELTNRLAAGDRRGACAMLRRVLAEGEPPVRLLAFLRLEHARGTAHRGAEGAGAGQRGDRASPNSMPSWMVGKRQHRAKARDLMQALWVLRRLDLELKSPAPPEAAFEAALLEIAAVSSRS